MPGGSVDLRHRVERGRRRHRRDAVDGVQPLVRELGALAQRRAERHLVRAIAGRARRRAPYSIGPVLHSRPSASFLIPASTSSSRSVRPTAIQPVRQPGARYAFESDENEMTGASGFERRERRHGAVEREVRVDLVGEQREVVLVGDLDRARGAPRSE